MSTDTQAAAPIELYQTIAADRVVRWGYDKTLDHDGLARFIREQAEDPNLRADADTAWRFAAGRNVGATTAGKEPATPSDADMARRLLDLARETAGPVASEHIAAAAVYAQLAALPPLDVEGSYVIAGIEQALDEAGVPVMPGHDLLDRVLWLIERHNSAMARLETYETGDNE